MMINPKMYKHFALALIISLNLAFAGCSSGEKRPDPINEVVIILDGSVTYKTRRTEAIAKISALLDSLAQAKVSRWEPSKDQIKIITVDAVPEVIWQGSIRDLKAMKQSEWAERFKARTDYEQCTDVEAAFKLAASNLQGDPQYVNKYLFAFTDLIHEPPTTSIRACRLPTKPSLPAEDFPWGELQDVSVSIFWVPPDQKLAWQRAVAEHRLGSSFALYTTSESSQVKITPPPKPTRKVTDEERAAERAADREGYTQGIYSFLKWAGIILGLIVALVVGFIVVGRSLGRRRSQAARAPINPRAVRPLPPSRLRRPRGLPSAAGSRPPSISGNQNQR